MSQLTVQQALQSAIGHHQAGELPQAEVLYRQILARRPQHADALHLLGVLAHQVGQQDHAVDLIRQAIALRPNFPAAYSNLSNVLRQLGQLDQAIAAARQAIVLAPGDLEAHNNLGIALQNQGLLDDAIAAFRQAIALKPDCAAAHANLGAALGEKGESDAALGALRTAIALAPDYAPAHNNRAMVLKDQGLVDGAMAASRQAMALRPDDPEAHSNLLLNLHYHPGYDVRTIAEEHRRWNRQHAVPLQKFIGPHANDRNPERRLRIGYVSPDLRAHVNGRTLLSLLEHHDRGALEIVAFAQVLVPDSLTEQLRACTDQWHNLVGLADEPAAELIRRQQIDILVDLAGHTAQNRLLLFARKPAPVQAAFLGYPDTTGLSTMDYRLTDAYADPPGQSESYYSEQLLRVSPCAWCYRPTCRPPVTARPAGPITFGCFNTFAKVTEPMLALWGGILQAVPRSRLLLKAAGLGSPSVRERVLAIFAQQGIAPERLELRGLEPTQGGHLALYGQVDLALDTFPYHGTNTTLEALWMGVPVVTLAGASHVSRVGVSLLSNLGLPELVAGSQEQYVRIATELAGDVPRRAHLRATLRQRLEQSPLMDAPRFARTIEAAYRQMWRAWCQKNAAS